MTSSWTKLTTRGVKALNIISRSIQSNLSFQYNIRGATKDDLDKIWNLIQTQVPNWSCDPHFIKIALEVFPGRIMIGEDIKTKKIVGLSSCVPVNDELEIASLHLTHEDGRGQRLGQQILHELRKINGEANLLGDSVPNAIELFEKSVGLRKLGSGLSYWTGKICHESHSRYDGYRQIDVKDVTKSSVLKISKYDRKIYPVCRDWFIERCIFEKPGVRVRIAVENDEVVGYGFTRPPPNNFYMSSLYANDVDIGRRIFSSAIFDIPDGAELRLCIPDDNEHASSLAAEIGLKPFYKFTRMIEKESLKFTWSQIFLATPSHFVLY